MDHGVDSEVHFKVDEEEERGDLEENVSAPPTPITQCDMEVIIRGWEDKFQKMLECLAEVQRTSERASSDICLVNHAARVQAEEHDRRLADFLRQMESARTPAKPRTSALRASTPKVYSAFEFDESPVGRDEVPHSELNSLPHTRSARTEEYDSIETHMGSARNTLPHTRSARTEEYDSIETHMGSARNMLPHIGSARTVESTDAYGDTRSTLPHSGSARTVDIADAFGDTHNTMPHTSSARTEESSRFRDTRTRDKDAHFPLDEQPTHEDDRRNSGDLQQSSYHPGHTLSFIELVLIRVAEYGLQLKSTKCNLFRSSVPFLGHIVGRAGLECDPSKVSAVANWIPPTTTKGVREFLGFTGYYRIFVPDYSTVAQPLVRLLGNDCKFHWTDACQDAFMALRALLIKAPVLAFPKEDLPYIVDTDASDYGIVAVEV